MDRGAIFAYLLLISAPVKESIRSLKIFPESGIVSYEFLSFPLMAPQYHCNPFAKNYTVSFVFDPHITKEPSEAKLVITTPTNYAVAYELHDLDKLYAKLTMPQQLSLDEFNFVLNNLMDKFVDVAPSMVGHSENSNEHVLLEMAYGGMFHGPIKCGTDSPEHVNFRTALFSECSPALKLLYTHHAETVGYVILKGLFAMNHDDIFAQLLV